MAVDEPDKIDIIAVNKEQTKLTLVLTDHLDWNSYETGEHLMMLQDKLNTYFAFLESDDLLLHRPNAREMALAVEVVFLQEPNAEAIDFLDLVGAEFAKDGYEFSYKTAK